MVDHELTILADHELVTLFIEKKEKTVFEVLYERYKNGVYFYVKRFIFSVREEVAEEIMDDIFVKVYMEVHSMKNYHAFKSWLFQVARTVCLKYLRKARLKTVSLENAGYGGSTMEIEDARVNIENDHIRQEYESAIWGEINKFSFKTRELIILKIVSQLTFEEVSEITEIPVHTVKYEIKKSLDSIGRTLRQKGYAV